MKALKPIIAALAAILATATAQAEGHAAAFLKSVEGYRARTYKDATGKPTIGYGFTSADMIGQGTISRQNASKALLRKCGEIKAQLRRELGNGVHLTQAEETALVSFIYNVGFNGFRRSTMCRLLKRGERGERVANEFLKWVYVRKGNRKVVSRGLVRRRRRERRLFLQ